METNWKELFEEKSPDFLVYDKQSGSRWLDKEKLIAFISQVEQAAFERGSKNPEIGVEAVYGFEAGKAALREELRSKVQGMKAPQVCVGYAPGDNAVGSEHRAFGYNNALGDVLTLLQMKDYSHYHCWDQKQPPACGLTVEHKQCCLCGRKRSTIEQ